MPTPSYDAIIVGSGLTGGWAAKELTEKGLNTLILEAGRPINPEKDYVEHTPVWELKYRNWDVRPERAKTQCRTFVPELPIQPRGAAGSGPHFCSVLIPCAGERKAWTEIVVQDRADEKRSGRDGSPAR